MSLPKPLYARVLKTEARSSTAAGKYWKMDLSTQAGVWPANIWDILEDESYPQKGNILKINKFKDQTDTKHGNISLKISDVEIIKLEEVPENLKDEIVKVPKAPKGWVKKAWTMINYPALYEDPKNFEFVQKCLSQYPKEEILKWPAAVSIHHHYQGGWVVHVSEVMLHAKNLAKSVNSTYKMVNSDVVVAAAALHDLGKMETYYLDELGYSQKYNTESSIGHFFYSMEIINKVGKELKIDSNFLNEVLHCVASHHGRIEYGSIKPVMSLEAIIVSMADNLSSKCGILDNKIRDIISAGGKIEDTDSFRFRGGERYIITEGLKKYIPEE